MLENILFFLKFLKVFSLSQHTVIEFFKLSKKRPKEETIQLSQTTCCKQRL